MLTVAYWSSGSFPNMFKSFVSCFVLDHPFIFIHIFTLCCELYSSLQFLIAQVWFGEGSSISFFPLYLSCLELLSFLRVGFLISLGKFSVISLQTLHLCPILLQNLSTYIMLELVTVSQSVFHFFFFSLFSSICFILDILNTLIIVFHFEIISDIKNYKIVQRTPMSASPNVNILQMQCDFKTRKLTLLQYSSLICRPQSNFAIGLFLVQDHMLHLVFMFP